MIIACLGCVANLDLSIHRCAKLKVLRRRCRFSVAENELDLHCRFTVVQGRCWFLCNGSRQKKGMIALYFVHTLHTENGLDAVSKNWIDVKEKHEHRIKRYLRANRKPLILTPKSQKWPWQGQSLEIAYWKKKKRNQNRHFFCKQRKTYVSLLRKAKKILFFKFN